MWDINNLQSNKQPIAKLQILSLVGQKLKTGILSQQTFWLVTTTRMLLMTLATAQFYSSVLLSHDKQWAIDNVQSESEAAEHI